ncbi:unnamed protein product [Bursaphelenchus okinawaensis]|uniref:Uncharacterized protein n=1 Tax=Bursaphelenchus okinawaensis TaxID=465554 RepID=A0A811K2Z6_9BILA|nr:unnamed protein product [Bursaphelenchus okinawaensis]CAG9089910.1 unnamed protein product [Bursaphelenchus okinawaensis]
MSTRTSFKEGLVLILRDFAGWTSTHAVPHMAMADKVWIFLFWTLVFIVCSGIMCFMIYTSVVKFLRFPTDLTSRLYPGKQNFPCITVCNMNPWKLSMIQGTPLEGLVTAYEAGVQNDYYGFQKKPFTMTDAMRATRWTRFMYEELNELDIATNGSLSYSFDDIMLRCQFLEDACNFTNNLNSFYDPYFGRCHTINSEFLWESSRAGPNYGMRVFFRTVLDDYLPWVQDSGIVYYIHGPDETPFQDAFGYFAAVGLATSAGVNYLERVKLKHPYNDCTDDGTELTNYYGNDYEVEACIRSCIQKAIINDCGCYDPQYNYPTDGNVTSCYLADNPSEKMTCADDIINSVDDGNDNVTFLITRDCDCLQACNQSYYQISMSQARWPAKTYVPKTCREQPTSQYWNNQSECVVWYQYNSLLLEVYFERTNYKSNKESASYTWVNLIADSGGQLGLWLGMSVLSLFEFAVLAGILSAYFIRKPPMPTLEGYNYWEEFDQQIQKNPLKLVHTSTSDYDPSPLVQQPVIVQRPPNVIE